MLCVLLCFLFLPQRADSQGFDWQYSTRMPAAYPSFFWGIVAGGNALNFSGTLRHLEKVEDPISGATVCRECGQFSGGDGANLQFGLRAEKWINGRMALSGSLKFERSTIEANEPLEPFDTRFYGPVESELVYSSTNQYLTLGVGYRYRFAGTHFTVGGGLEAAILLSSDPREVQKILSPSEASFLINGRNVQEREVSGDLTESADMVLAARLLAGYDLALSRGLYASPALVLGIPVTSVAKDVSWRSLGIGFQVSILYGTP